MLGSGFKLELALEEIAHAFHYHLDEWHSVFDALWHDDGRIAGFIVLMGDDALSGSLYIAGCHTSLQVDGGSFSSPGRCYLHLQDFQNERAHSIAWGALKKAMSDQNRAPEGVSTDQILQAMRLLGFAEPKLSKGP